LEVGLLHRNIGGCAAAVGFVAAVASAPAYAGDRVLPSLPVVRYELGNGLKVLLAPDPSLIDVSVVVHYDVGSADDPPGKNGLAHLVEHLMFDGSRHVAPGDYSRWIARAGGANVNGMTRVDDTNYFVTVPPASLPLIFWLESDRMAFLADRVSSQSINTEVQLISDETRDRVYDRRTGMLASMGRLNLFPREHPYHRDATAVDLMFCGLDDVRAFLRTWYSPSNATIAVAGRFDVAATRSLIDQYFGDLPASPPPQRPALPARWRVHDVRIDAGAGIPSDVVTFMWATPALGQADDAALDLAAEILADPQGRLQHDLVAAGLAVSVDAKEMSSPRASTFAIMAALADGAAPDAVVARIERAVSDLAAGVRLEECKRAQDEAFDRQMLRLEGSLGRATALVETPTAAASWNLGEYDAFGPAQVAAAVRADLVPDRRVVVVMHHDPQYPGRGVVLKTQARLP
jgi:zinc protease